MRFTGLLNGVADIWLELASSWDFRKIVTYICNGHQLADLQLLLFRSNQMSNRGNRRTYFVDKKVQGALLARAARYWVLSLLVVGALSILGWMFIAPGMPVLVELRSHLPALLGGFAIALLASLVVLPVILYDLARMSNRFAGPMSRLRQSMKRAADGERVSSVYFRDDDYWQEFADAFNELNDRLQLQEKTITKLELQCEEELTASV